MTPKIEKIAGEIQKTRARIAQDEARVEELEKLKRELENEEIISRVRASEVPLKEIGTFLHTYRETGLPPPDAGTENVPRAARRPRVDGAKEEQKGDANE